MIGIAALPRIDFDIRGRWAGVAAAAALGLAANWIAGGLGDPLARNPVLVAMLFGLILGSVFGCPAALRPGLDFTKRYLLRLGIMLLGFRITVALLGDLGIVPIGIAAAELIVVLAVVRWVALRVFKLDPHLALLVAVGSAVCGAAAILSVASLTKAREQYAGVAITLITIAGTVALLLYPIGYLDGWMPGIDERGFGITVGASIFELAQVYGASYAVSEGALNIATLVKLSKVVMLIPLLLVLGAMQAREPGFEARRRVPVPWFVVGFLAVLLLNSVITVHPQVRSAILQGDQFLFLMVTIALGLTTPLAKLRDGSGALRLIGVGVFALVLSAGVAYGFARAAQPSAAIGVDTLATTSGGARLFDSVGCGKCHVPSLHGVKGDVILYSDLLLHDMGTSLDDKIVQGSAMGADWRTTPLAGLGARDRFLHDGRAATLRDAVLEHGGEADIVRRRFFELDESDQKEVYRFLSSL
jgi:uncharacterized integral membrane protein (TIGR00698 family)